MKQGEIDYMKNLGDEGARSAFDKPFSRSTCSKNLVDLGIIMALLPAPPARLLDLGCGTEVGPAPFLHGEATESWARTSRRT